MRRLAGLTALACITASLATSLSTAQDRPENTPRAEEPERAPDDARPPENHSADAAAPENTTPEGTRPPEKPADVAETQDSGANTSAPEAKEPTSETDVTASDEQAAAEEKVESNPALFIGPPPMPEWYRYKESDADFDSCKLALSVLGTRYKVLPAEMNPENPACGIARPIEVDQILPDLTLEGGAVMRCDTARSLALWAHDFLLPAATSLPDAPRITSLQLGTTYDCRGRVGTGEASPKLSEHSYGNAIDIMAVGFDKGDPLPIERRQDTGNIQEAFQRTIRGAACLYFTTVLGPGSNEAHDDHLHFDVAARKNGWRLCQ